MGSKVSLRRLQTFCLYCSLRAGVLIAFGFIMLYYVLFAVMIGVWLIWLAEWKRDKLDPHHREGLNSWHTTSICAFVFAALNIIAAVCVLVAVTKRFYHLVIPALIILFVTIAINLVYIARKISLLSKVSPMTGDDMPVAELFQCIVYDVFFCSIMGYMWAILLSYYLQMIDKNLVSPSRVSRAEELPVVRSVKIIETK